MFYEGFTFRRLFGTVRQGLFDGFVERTAKGDRLRAEDGFTVNRTATVLSRYHTHTHTLKESASYTEGSTV